MSTADDRRRLEAAHVEILRRLCADGSDDQIVTYLRGSHLGAVASAIANVLRGAGELAARQTIIAILHADHPEWFGHDALPVAVAVPTPSIQKRFEELSEAEARAVLRELREAHPEFFA